MAHKSPTRNGEDSGEDSTVWDVRPARGDLECVDAPAVYCVLFRPPAPVARELMSEEEERL